MTDVTSVFVDIHESKTHNDHMPATITLKPFTTDPVEFPAYAIPTVAARILDFNKRAVRHGIAPTLLTEISRRYQKAQVTDQGWIPGEHYVTVTLSGVSYDIEGYTLIGTAEIVNDNGAIEHIVKAGPAGRDLSLVGSFRGTECDHCGVSRNRGKLVLLRDDETGELVQLGRQCVRLYLGDAAETTLWYSESDSVLDAPEGGWAAGGHFSTAQIVSTASLAVQVYGYVKTDGNYPTAARVRDGLSNNREARERSGLKSLDQDAYKAAYLRADAAIRWILEDADVSRSDYLHNLRLAAKGLGRNPHNLLCSLPQAYAKAVEFASAKVVRDAEAAGRAATSTHVGAVGERLTVTGTVETHSAIEGDYGTSYLVTIRTVDGNVFKVWGTSKGLWNLERGAQTTWTGTVKAHEIYKGTAQTVLTRVKVCA